MKEKTTASTAVSKQPRRLDWQVAVRRLPASPNAMPDGCSLETPPRQTQAQHGTQG